MLIEQEKVVSLSFSSIVSHKSKISGKKKQQQQKLSCFG